MSCQDIAQFRTAVARSRLSRGKQATVETWTIQLLVKRHLVTVAAHILRTSAVWIGGQVQFGGVVAGLRVIDGGGAANGPNVVHVPITLASS